MIGFSASSIISAYSKSYRSYRREKLYNETNKIKLDNEHIEIVNIIKTQLIEKNYLTSAKKCPECNKFFKIIKVKGLLLDTCISCKSLWFDNGELKKLTGLSKDIPSDNLKHRKSKYNCPVCNQIMNEYLYINKSNLLVDKCQNNHGVYLESGELERVFSLSKK